MCASAAASKEQKQKVVETKMLKLNAKMYVLGRARLIIPVSQRDLPVFPLPTVISSFGIRSIQIVASL